MRNIVVIDFIINKPWTLKEFNNLDLSKFSKNEIDLFNIIKILKSENKEINGQNIHWKAKEILDAALATKMLLLYMLKSDEIDMFKFQTKKRK